MNHIITICNKVFAFGFYRQNAFFFLIAIAFCCGFLSGREHIALAQFFVSAPFTLLFPFLVWISYALKAHIYIRQAACRKENEFLRYVIILLPKSIRYISVLLVWINILMPVIMYASFLVFIAVQFKQYASVGIVITYLIMMITIGTMMTSSLLIYPDRERKISLLKTWLDKKFRKPYSLIITEWVIRRDLLTFVAIKILSSLLLSAILFIYSVEFYDNRLLAMAIVIAFGGGGAFIFLIHQLESTHLSWIRNLPLTLTQRLTSKFFCLAILCLPEACIVYGNFPGILEGTDFLLFTLLGLSILILFHGLLYRKSLPIKKFIRMTFYLTLLEVMLLLFRIPVLAVVIFNISFGILLYRKYYYSFETLADNVN